MKSKLNGIAVSKNTGVLTGNATVVETEVLVVKNTQTVTKDFSNKDNTVTVNNYTK